MYPVISNMSNDDKETTVMKELPLKKKPKNRRKKKVVDDDLQFLDSVIIKSKNEIAETER